MASLFHLSEPFERVKASAAPFLRDALGEARAAEARVRLLSRELPFEVVAAAAAGIRSPEPTPIPAAV